MTKKDRLVAKLETIADTADAQVAAVANILLDYFRSEDKKDIGFKK